MKDGRPHAGELTPPRPTGRHAQPLVLAHRGASGHAPENTFAAFDLAVDLAESAGGAMGIETDVRATADGQLVLVHDERVDRTTDGQGRVADLTLAEIRALDAGLRFAPRFAGQRVPTLAEFLDRYGRHLPLCLEVKAPGVDARLLDLVRSRGLLDAVEFTSFGPEVVRRLHELAPDARLGYLTRAFDQAAIAETLALGATQICPPASALTAESIGAARAVGLTVRAWGLADDALLAKAIDLGVDGFTTNWPDRAFRRVRPSIVASGCRASL